MGDDMARWYSAPLQLGTRKNYSYVMSHIDSYFNLLDIYGSVYDQRQIPISIIRWADNITVDSRHQLPFYKKDFRIADEQLFVLPGWHYLQEQTPGKLTQRIDEIIKATPVTQYN